MKIILKHFIAIALLLLIPVVALCCEKESPLNISHLMNEDFIREAKVQEEWGSADIEYEPLLSYRNSDSENSGKNGKQDNWDFVDDPIGFDVFLFVLVFIAGSFFIVSGIMSYKIIHGNPATNLKEE